MQHGISSRTSAVSSNRKHIPAILSTAALILGIFWLVNVSILHSISNTKTDKKLGTLEGDLRKDQLQLPHNETQPNIPTILHVANNKTLPVVSKQNIRRVIEYGIFSEHPKRSPYVMIHSHLGEIVYQKFLSQNMFQCPQSELEHHGLAKAVDYPRSKDTHTYFEGYFHSLPTSKPVLSRNPRSGKEFQKPAAILFIRSFYESFRRVNNATFFILHDRLMSSALSRVSTPQDDVCAIFASWIQRGYHFGDLSVQIHIGSQIRGDELFWHSDAENSLLHFGVTVKGTRILHTKRAKSQRGDVRDVLEVLNPGSVYLSASTLVNHAPEYRNTTWSNRIIAIHSRILYSTADLKNFRAKRTTESWDALADILADFMSQMEMKIPSIAQVEETMKQLEKANT